MALPVRSGFGRFYARGAAAAACNTRQEKGHRWGRRGWGGAETVKVRGSPSVLKYAATSSAISHMCLGLSAFGETGQREEICHLGSVFMKLDQRPLPPHSRPPPETPHRRLGGLMDDGEEEGGEGKATPGGTDIIREYIVPCNFSPYVHYASELLQSRAEFCWRRSPLARCPSVPQV